VPDFERFTDDLREHLAKSESPERAAYERGFTEGKNHARLELLIAAVLWVVVMWSALAWVLWMGK
jgi:hypothetical protein